MYQKYIMSLPELSQSFPGLVLKEQSFLFSYDLSLFP